MSHLGRHFLSWLFFKSSHSVLPYSSPPCRVFFLIIASPTHQDNENTSLLS